MPVSELMGKTTAEVMPPIAPKMRWQARVDWVAFFLFSFFANFVVDIFFIGDVLMSARLVLVGIFALIDRFRKRRLPAGVYEPFADAVPGSGTPLLGQSFLQMFGSWSINNDRQLLVLTEKGM